MTKDGGKVTSFHNITIDTKKLLEGMQSFNFKKEILIFTFFSPFQI